MQAVKIERVSDYRAASNRNSAITVTTSPRDRGWVIQVKFPKRAPAEDRKKLLEWMMSYRSQIRQHHPYWYASFRTHEDGYLLKVTPVKNQRDLREVAEEQSDAALDTIMDSYAEG